MDFLHELRPILTSMSLLGLFYSPCKPNTVPDADPGNENRTNEGTDAHSPSSRLACIRRISLGSRYYCLLVCFSIWFQLLRFLPAYWVGIDHQKGMLQTRVVTTCWYLQCALNATIMYRGCTKPEQLQSFVVALKEHSVKYPSYVPSEQQVGQLKRRLRVTTTISWTFNILNILLVGLTLLDMHETSKLYAVVFTDPFGTSLPSKIIAMILYCFTSSAWVFPITFSCGFYSYLRLRFKTLTTNLEAAISTSEHYFPPEVETFRRQHIHLCECVRVLDRMMNNLIMASYVTNIPLMCFLMYNLVYSRGDAFQQGVLAFWLTVNSLNVFFISVWAALVHEEVGHRFPSELVVWPSSSSKDTRLETEKLQARVWEVTGSRPKI